MVESKLPSIDRDQDAVSKAKSKHKMEKGKAGKALSPRKERPKSPISLFRQDESKSSPAPKKAPQVKDVKITDDNQEWGTQMNEELSKIRQNYSMTSDVESSSASRIQSLVQEAVLSAQMFEERGVVYSPITRYRSQRPISPFCSPDSPQPVFRPQPEETQPEEKKETDAVDSQRKTRFSHHHRKRPNNDTSSATIQRTISATESDVGSVDGLPSGLQTKWNSESRDVLLQNLDGVSHLSKPKASGTSWPFSFIWGGQDSRVTDAQEPSLADDSLGLLGCADIYQRREHRYNPIGSSLIRVPKYVTQAKQSMADLRMKEWIDRQFTARGHVPKDGNYYSGRSRTVIVHEIARGNWTWCTDWSPNGDLLAVATENHHLAIVDTTASTVWRVRHDRKISGPVRNNTTHSVRSIAWGRDYIAIGGTGNAVSLLSTVAPYGVLHRITGTGFVGSLQWRNDNSILAIATRLGKALLYRISTEASERENKVINSEIVHTISSDNWMNVVAFSADGDFLATGDAGGNLSVHSVTVDVIGVPEVELVKTFKAEDSILDLEWSPDSQWLYAGGEDFKISMIDTKFWEIVHVQDRQKWVQCIASSRSGSHVAVGGVSSEISILDVKNGWDSVMGMELKGLVPLSAKWHPRDQFLAMTGQSNSVIVVETTNVRHVVGHHLQSVSPVLTIDFSPDGSHVIVGNKSGVVTMFELTDSGFVTTYELVISETDRICTKWSGCGRYVMVGSKDSLTILGRSRQSHRRDARPPQMSGYSVRHVLREFGNINDISIDPHTHYIAVSGNRTWIIDSTASFSVCCEFKGICYANAWSLDGKLLATIGARKVLTIYNTSDPRAAGWSPLFKLECDYVGRAVAFGPKRPDGLMHLACGGDNNEISVLEIRGREGTWETILRLPRDGAINSLDWSSNGLLAAAIGNGTVSIIDLSYLQCGVAANEMDYNWQRQAVTSFTEIRRNRGKNAMQSVRWMPDGAREESLLAVGGSDGELELIDLTERSRCRGYDNPQQKGKK